MRKKNTELLREVISQVLREQHLDKPLNEKRVVDAWPAVLGSNIMQYTSALSVRNAVLYVTLTSSVLRHDLFLSKTEIINSLNKAVGVDAIREIIFQ